MCRCQQRTGEGFKKMKQMLIGNLIKLFVGMLSPELLKTFVDMMLDFVENYVEGSKSEIDDRIVLPLCDTIRASFNIPDNDPE